MQKYALKFLKMSLLALREERCTLALGGGGGGLTNYSPKLRPKLFLALGVDLHPLLGLATPTGATAGHRYSVLIIYCMNG